MVMIQVKGTTYNPHSCILICTVSSKTEVMNKGACVPNSIVQQHKKKLDMYNVKSMGTILYLGFIIAPDKNAVEATMATVLPVGKSMDSFTVHATNATEVTRSIKSCHSHWINGNTCFI
jgi:hypothetical protein